MDAFLKVQKRAQFLFPLSTPRLCFGVGRLAIVVVLPLLLCLFFPTASAIAQGKGGKGKSLRGGIDTSALEPYDLQLSTDLGRMISTGEGDIYDPITVSTLRRLKDEAQPPLEPSYVDETRTQKVVEKALAMQSVRNLSRTLQRSDLRDVYREVREAFRDLQDFFRFSVKDDGESLVMDQDSKGEKLLELSLELNAKQGFDPELRFSESVRLRYDFQEGRPMLEYGVDF